MAKKDLQCRQKAGARRRDIMAKDLGTVRNSRSTAQREHMENTVGKGVCPFCQIDPELNHIIMAGKFWNVWHNPFPYRYRRNHMILALKEHIVDVREMTSEMWAELGDLVKQVTRELGIEAGAVVMRFGDSQFTGSTLQHLHVHIDEPDGAGPAYVFLHRVPLGPDSSRQEAEVFESFRARE